MTKDRLLNAITRLSETMPSNFRKSIPVLIKTTTLPELVRIVVYQLFITDFDVNGEFKEDYELLRFYAKTLRDNGFVNFD